MELYEGVKVIVRTNNKQVHYNGLKAYSQDVFSTVADYDPVKGSIIKLTDYCDSDFDLLFEDSIIVSRDNNTIIEEKIFAVI